MQHRFILVCQRPVFGVWGNKFFRMMDLGIEGVYVPSTVVITVETKRGYNGKLFKEKLVARMKEGECRDIVLYEISEAEYKKLYQP